MVKSVFDLDMTPGRMLPLIINVSQYDDIGRTIVFNLYSSVGAWTAPTSASVTFEGGKPDGKFFAYNCAYSSGTVTVTIQQQMTAVAGKVRCKVKVTSGNKVVESAPIIMIVDAAAVPDGSDMSKSDINDAIANATQKIVDQVKDNIPSDYSQLSTDVSSLKSDIDNYQSEISENIPNIFDGNFDQFGYIDSTGDVGENQNFKRTSKFYPFNIGNGAAIFIHLSKTTPNFAVLVYNSSKKFIKSITCNNYLDAESIIAESGYFRIWTNASFDGKAYVGQIIFSEYNSYSNHKISDQALNKNISKALSKAELIEEVVGKNLFDKNADGVIKGKYLRTDGGLESLDGWYTSDYIDISSFSSVTGSVWTKDNKYFAFCKLYYMHKYNSDKAHLGKVWDSSSNGTYQKDDDVKYIRFCWNINNEVFGGRKIMLEAGNSHSDMYEEYILKTSLKNSEYIEKTDIEDAKYIKDGAIKQTQLETSVQQKLNNISSNIQVNEISCWGDSLTYSHNTTIKDYPNVGSVTYPSKLAELTGFKTTNLGMPGANSMDISGLQGGMPIYLDPFTLPADTSTVDVTLRDANGDSNYIGLLHWMPRNGWVNPLANMGLNWNINGIPVNLIYGSGVMKVSRIAASDQSNTFDRPVKIIPMHEYAKNQIQIFFVGTNDAPTTKEKAERVVKIVQNMVNFYGGDKYLVVGLTDKRYAEYTNPLLAQTFGSHYVNVKDYMIKYGLSDNGLEPTEQDQTDIADAKIPTSLYSDSIHFNDYGYTALALCIYLYGKMLGYWN